MQNTEEKTQKRIFAVDDDTVMLSTLKTVLNSAGYILSAAMKGEAALQYLDTHAVPDLILLDVEIPDMSGYELLEKIKSSAATSHIPVIFLTAKDENDDEFEGLTFGAVDYINKSTPPKLLLRRIEVHLLVASQKQKLISQQQELIFQKQQLIDFNENLQQMVEDRVKIVIDEFRNVTIGDYAANK